MRDDIREARWLYLMNHFRCAYCEVVPEYEYPHCKLGDNLELEHVWQRMGKKIDDVQNYVPACRTSHHWKHLNTQAGRIAAIYWKWKNGEFDRDRLRELIDKDPIGWMSTLAEKPDQLPAWAIDCVHDMLECF